LYYIGLVVFLFNIILFPLLCSCMALRAIWHPKHFRTSFTDPKESFFLGSFWLSISTIIGGIQVYGITHGPAYPWLITTVYILYWLYAGFSLANSILQYWVLIMWSSQRPVPYSPSIFLAGYSAMLTGTLSSLIAGHQNPHRATLVIVSGCAYQGFGWCISLVAIVAFVGNVLDNGLPPPSLRPGLFIPVGACAYTIVALIGQANAIPEDPSYGYFARHVGAAETLRVMALFIGIFLWLFAFWLFAIAVLGNVSVVGRMAFSLSWWAFIFPNVGFTLSTSMIGQELESEAILWVASGMTALLVAIWLVSAVGCIRSVWKGAIVWPGKDEDKDR
jgi:tellurite resistance protein TehA-like permease